MVSDKKYIRPNLSSDLPSNDNKDNRRHFKLTIKSHPKELSQVRDFITDTLSKTMIPAHESHLITLAVNEACANIIKHGYNNDFNQQIKITINLKIRTLTISIRDKGIKFDIHSIEPRDVSEVKPGGLGLHIIDKVMDRVEYSETSQNINKLTMVKKLLS